MKPLGILMISTLALAALNVVAADDHHPRYGGQVRETASYDLELVVKDKELTLYITDHSGKKIDTKGARATAIVLAGKAKEIVHLDPAGGNVLKGSGNFAVSTDTKVLVTLTADGMGSEQVRFTPMAKAAAGDHKCHKH